MQELTETCPCCDKLKVVGDNEFWVNKKPDGTYYTWCYCNYCFNRFHLDGTYELRGADGFSAKGGTTECTYCMGNEDCMDDLANWRHANQ